MKGFYFIVGFSNIREGELGVISEVLEQSGNEENRYFYLIFDYVVFVGNEQILMFEEEIEKIPENFNPCSACGCDPCDCDWGHGIL